ncbi:MAG: MMPL family transporter [Mycobacteriaceae bacterium]
MLTRLTRRVIAAPRRVLACALAFLLFCGIFGSQVGTHLAAGGFQDPSSESALAGKILNDTFSRGGLQVVLKLSDESNSNEADGNIALNKAAQARAFAIESELSQFDFVQKPMLSLWSNPQAASALQSKDKTAGLIVVAVSGGDKEAAANAKKIADKFTGTTGGITIQAGGQALVYSQVNTQTTKDLTTTELIAIPISFLLLIWVFGGLFAAALPLVIGIFAIIGTSAILRGFTAFTDVSIFALNLTTVMGLALAIDYTLLIINRYREELHSGLARPQAIERAMATAGRTVLFSAITVALSLVAMIIFPMYFLRSFAYAGLGVVALAALAALVVTPAIISLLDNKIDSLDVRKPLRRLFGKAEPRIIKPEESIWYRSTQFVLRHAIAVGLAVITLLLILGAPFLNINFGYPDDRVLPQSASSHQLGDELRHDYAQNASATVTIVLPDTQKASPADLRKYLQDLSRIRNITSVIGPEATFINGLAVSAGDPAAVQGNSQFLTLTSTVDPFSETGKDQLNALHQVPSPAGMETLFTGLAQQNVDNVNSIIDHLPAVIVLIVITTFILLFLLTGSVILPLKALILNVFALSATFGAMVWIFQEGNLGGLGTEATGTLIANMPVLMFCIAFGLSMDYEVFLLSRIGEEWQKSDKTREANDHAVAYGLARTGRVVTTAALLMSIVFAGIIASQVSFMRMFGLGLTLAVLMDATLIRMFLVPAFMRVAGRLNWWAPPPLRRFHNRFGLHD